jgi:hypothetical protein
MFQDYVKNELKWETDLHYPTSGNVCPWTYDQNRNMDMTEALRSTMTHNPFMKVFVATGYHGMATIMGGTEFNFTHLAYDKQVTDRISYGYYEAAHMIYVRPSAHKALKADVAKFIQETRGPMRAANTSQFSAVGTEEYAEGAACETRPLCALVPQQLLQRRQVVSAGDDLRSAPWPHQKHSPATRLEGFDREPEIRNAELGRALRTRPSALRNMLSDADASARLRVFAVHHLTSDGAEHPAGAHCSREVHQSSHALVRRWPLHCSGTRNVLACSQPVPSRIQCISRRFCGSALSHA